MYNEFKKKYLQIAQPHIIEIKSKIDSAERKLIILTISLISLSIGIFLLTKYVNLHIIFFYMTIFISAMIFYVGKYAFRYEYQDILTTKIFPKILKCIDESANFFIYQYDELNTDGKNSNFFNLFNISISYVPITSSSLLSKWSFTILISDKKTKIASTYLNQDNINNPSFSFFNKHGLFIVVDSVQTNIKELYIFEKSIFPSFKEISTSYKQELEKNKLTNKNHVVIAKPLNEQNQNIVSDILMNLKNNISLSIKNNTLYIFISNEFRCFNPENYTNGNIPDDFNYKGLIEVIEIIKKLITVIEKN
jgi:hypothetical protein